MAGRRAGLGLSYPSPLENPSECRQRGVFRGGLFLFHTGTAKKVTSLGDSFVVLQTPVLRGNRENHGMKKYENHHPLLKPSLFQTSKSKRRVPKFRHPFDQAASWTY